MVREDMRRWIFKIALLHLLSFCYGYNDQNEEKHQIVKDIVGKLDYAAKKSFSNVDPKYMNKYIKLFEDKVKRIAESMGISDPNYSQVIMRGIKIMASNYNKRNNYRKSDLLVKPDTELSNLTLVNEQQSNDLKQNMLSDITNKVWKLGIYYKDKPRSEKFKILKHINDKIASLADVEQSRRKYESKFSKIKDKEMNLKGKKGPINELFEITDLEVKKNYEVGNATSVDNEITTTSTEATVHPVTGAYSCITASESVCSRLEYTFKIICPHDHKKIDLNKMCDGQRDCTGGYDELNCLELATNKIKDASQLMADIQGYLLKECLKNKNDVNLLIKQNTILTQILQDQLNVILSSRAEKDFFDHLSRKTVNEMSVVLKTLSMAIRSSICGNNQIEDDKFFSLSLKNNALTKKERQMADFEDTLLVSHDFPADLCRCENGFCTESNCHIVCRRECWQRYSLLQWGCVSTTGGTSVPLDVICDGKIDCIEKTDELECSSDDNLAKFKATKMYEEVLESILTMAMTKEHSVVLVDLQNFLAAVKKLQKVTVQDKPDPIAIKNVRDSCFSMLVAIYEKIAFKGDVRNLGETHFMLLTMNKKLVSAMKYSHTGNVKMVPENGCYCAADRCVLVNCTKKCNQACTMQGNITRYSCQNNENITIPLSAICDVKADCPLKDDEEHCKEDVCRNHHLVVLRDIIRDIDDSQKDTVLGLALSSWKTKATSKLMAAESSTRPTSTLLRDLIDEMLRDLVYTYGYVVETKRNKDQILTEYGAMKQRFVATIKSCRK